MPQPEYESEIVGIFPSAERLDAAISDPYRSAMSMLTFYINRAGRNLPSSRKRTLNKAKEKLRELFDKAA